MTSEEKYAFCHELLYGFVDAIPEEKVKELQIKHIMLFIKPNSVVSSKYLNTHYPVFKATILPSIVLNKLLSTKYSHMFTDLEPNQIAELLNIPRKTMGSVLKQAIRKLKLLNIRKPGNEFKEIKLLFEQIHCQAIE